MQTEFARAQMITQQIRAWDVLDERVLDAMRRTPREIFVPERYAELAFGTPASRYSPVNTCSHPRLSDVSCRRWTPNPACAHW